MRVRVIAISIATAVMLSGASARAQISLPSPTNITRSVLPHKKLAASPGTGSFVTSMVASGSPGARALGNAATVTFTDPTAGTGQSGASVQHPASTVQVQYPADNQLVQAAVNQTCGVGCVMPKFTIQTQVGTSTMTWDLQNVLITQLQTSPSISINLRYDVMMLTTGPTAATGTASKATYNVTTQKQQ